MSKLIAFLAFVGFSVYHEIPENTPEGTMSAYFDALLTQDYEIAYKLLAEKDQKEVSLEDFTLYHELSESIDPIDGYAIEKTEDTVVDITVDTTLLFYDNEISSYTESFDTVLEEEMWKYDRHEDWSINWTHKIAESYFILSLMHENGFGVKEDPEYAEELFRKGYELFDQEYEHHFSLGVAYEVIGYPDLATEEFQSFLVKETDKKHIGLSYLHLAMNHLYLDETKQAKKYLEKAKALIPENALLHTLEEEFHTFDSSLQSI